jgi:hypothetical protein
MILLEHTAGQAPRWATFERSRRRAKMNDHRRVGVCATLSPDRLRLRHLLAGRLYLNLQAVGRLVGFGRLKAFT